MMHIKILGMGCRNCRTLEAYARQAAAELGIEAEFEEVKDMDKIMSYDVMMTPALVVNEKVKVAGRVPSKEEVKKLLAEEA
ncbi:MAG: hypothetical protein PWQ41_149 [Bacillota bacterium]|jgi:small redox-active disulfide protein 2|nr:hypothetical protein [Bacillota bacterium]MDK2855697.1 hypothetical protein [Bacillota bacterium]MDK2924375.1 hypothetical protein [Bacillota bacterium]